ncbi:MAG: serine acetyltransferase [Proteobacteria bacterium]|nr:serine acetyltransferase [Pseudomonadota bacterium]
MTEAEHEKPGGNTKLACCASNKPLTESTRSTKNLTEVVDSLFSQCNAESKVIPQKPGRAPLPSRDVLITMVEEIRSVFFPSHFGISELNGESTRFHMGSTLDRVVRTLQDQVRRGLCFDCPQDTPECCNECEDRALQITHIFLSALPRIRELLSSDVAAAYEGDPAATCPDEAVFCYPGIQAITNYRLAHELHLLEVPLIPRIITEHAHSITGIDIHPGATIGEKFFIDHGTGIVIGETSEIGNRVRIYQGVTLGAKSFPLDENGNPIKNIPRHPIVEDDVVIYSGATILGRVSIGRGSVIGGNVWLTRSVSPNSHITQAQVRQDRFTDGGGI